MNYLQKGFKRQFLINEFKQGVWYRFEYYLRAKIGEYSIWSYRFYNIKFQNCNSHSKSYCNFNFTNKIKVRSYNVHLPIPEIYDLFTFCLGNSRNYFGKCYLHFSMWPCTLYCWHSCYYFPHLNNKVLSFFHYLTLIS